MAVQRSTCLSAVFILVAILVWGVAIGAEQVSRNNSGVIDDQKTQDQKTQDGESTTAAKPATKKVHSARSDSTSRILPAPRGPVRIVHIEGTNILLIIGQGSGRKPNLRLPKGPVTIEAIDELNLLIIKSGGK